MEESVQLNVCRSFQRLPLNQFAMVHQYTFKQFNTGYVLLLMLGFWRICCALGLGPSEIINQYRPVISICV